jgi:hypothetical protein
MPRDLDAFATHTVLIIQTALAPLVERLAVAETKAAKIDSLIQELAALREAVAVVQAKTVPEPQDLTPVLERMASAEARLSTLGDLRDRVVVVETKAAAAVPLLPLPPEAGYDDLRDRIKTLETKAAGPSAAELADVRERVTALERRVTDDALTKELGSLRERIAVLEVRPMVPGPKGEPGEPGKDGLNGKDGSAGLSFEGVYQEGQTYEKGHLVTWGGSSWHANEQTMAKPGDSKAWTLMVKRGRDGRDGRDAVAVPVVSVGRS